MIFKLLFATIIGWFIGRERKNNDKVGGSRTFAIVCLGATLVAILTQKLAGGLDNSDQIVLNYTRMMSYTIASMGFIGSGLIRKENGEVEGLTTASTLFVLIPVGFAIGFGYYITALLCGGLLYWILEYKYRH